MAEETTIAVAPEAPASTPDPAVSRREAAMAALGPLTAEPAAPEDAKTAAPKDAKDKAPAEPKPEGEPEKTDAEKKAEALVSPQLAAVQRAKKRALDEVAAAKAEFAKERAPIEAERPDFEAFKAAKAAGDDLALIDSLKWDGARRVKLGEALLYGEMGDDAPADWKQRKELWAVKRKAEAAERTAQEFVRKQEAAQATQAREQQDAAEIANARTFLTDYVKTKIDDKRPYLQVQAEANPGQLVEEILRIARAERRARAAELKIPEHEVPETEGRTADEIADDMEQRLAKALDPYKVKWQAAPIPPKPTTPSAEETKPASKTLSNRTASPTPSKPAALTAKERRERAIVAFGRDSKQ